MREASAKRQALIEAGIAIVTPGEVAECVGCKGAGYRTKAAKRDEAGRVIATELVACPACSPKPSQDDLRKAAGLFSVKTFLEWQTNEATLDAYAACHELLGGKRTVVFLRGGPGIGKTHLAIATCDKWLERGMGMAMFVNVPDFLASLKATFDRESAENTAEVFDAYADAPLLVLDDLGAEYRTHWALAEIYRVIDRRYRAKLPLIVTSNVQDNEQIDARVLSRLRPGEVVIRGAKDRRKEFER